MIISTYRKFIFIHIYKNAGTSITKSLLPYSDTYGRYWLSRLLRPLHIRVFDVQPYHDHITAPELISHIGRDVFDSFFSFAIVRNPWDWQVSLYNYTLKTPKHYQHHFIKGLGSFDAYIRWRCTEEIKLQSDFIYSSDGELLVDFVGRFETLDDDIRTIYNRIGIEASLPKLNVSGSRPYRDYYSPHTMALVESTFEKDISLFGYSF